MTAQIVARMCSVCHLIRLADDFRDNRQRCRRCQEALRKTDRLARPEHYRAIDARYRDRERQRIASLAEIEADTERRQRATTARRAAYRSLYGIDLEDYEALLVEQAGMCALCGRTREDNGGNRLSIDHDHEHDTVRGLLCIFCNRSLGWVERIGVDLIALYLERGKT